MCPIEFGASFSTGYATANSQVSFYPRNFNDYAIRVAVLNYAARAVVQDFCVNFLGLVNLLSCLQSHNIQYNNNQNWRSFHYPLQYEFTNVKYQDLSPEERRNVRNIFPDHPINFQNPGTLVTKSRDKFGNVNYRVTGNRLNPYYYPSPYRQPAPPRSPPQPVPPRPRHIPTAPDQSRLLDPPPSYEEATKHVPPLPRHFQLPS